MNIADKISQVFVAPQLTRRRIWFAFIVAGLTDTLQILLGFVGWLGFDEVLDVMAMILTSAAIGFHMLLLPTFVIELLPVADMLPTWTGCTAAVVMLRRRAQTQAAPPPLPAKMANVSSPPVSPDTTAPAESTGSLQARRG